MEIRIDKKDGLILTTDKAKMLLAREDDFKGDGYDIVISKKYSGDKFHIEIPGEYEVSGISIMAASSSMDENVDLIEIVIDDINVLYLFEQFKYSKQIHDSLGSTDILITRTSTSDSVADFITKFDPEVFVPFGDEKIVKEMLEKTGITQIQNENKLKFKSDRFGGEEFKLETYVLNS